MLEQFRAARRVGTPLVAINCFDPEATMASIQAMVKEIEDSKNLSDKERSVLIQWDVIRGWGARDNLSIEAIKEVLVEAHIEVEATEDPVEHLVFAEKLRPKSMLFIMGGHNYLDKPPYIQALWNLRDQFKTSRRMVVLLGPMFSFPAELQQDFLVLDEALPNDAELRKIVEITVAAAKVADKVSEDDIIRAIDALRGLPTFPAEQATAMCLSPDGLDTEELWERKRSLVGQTAGLSVFKEGAKFEDLGGLEAIKERFSRIIKGKAAPKVIVFVDEIEKAMAGTASGVDGTAQDQLGVFLTEMTEKNYSGALFVGPPGAAKSAFAKSVGVEAGILTIKMDLGAMKGNGLVGQAEKEIRHAMKVIEAVGGLGGAFFIATSNDIRVIKPELKRRMKKGIWYFDLPNAKERQAIWKIFCAKYGEKYRPDRINFDTDWTGAEIENCVATAWEEGITFEEASKGIIPVAISASKDIERLRSESNGKYNSVSTPGAYVYMGGRQQTDPTASERSINFQD